jgi:hypothetical protein
MADITRQPLIRTALADSLGVVLSFASVGVMGSAYVVNNGPDECWIAFDAVPAVAAYGMNQKHLAMGESLNLDDIAYTTVGALCAGADTAQVEVVGLIRSGSSGQGVG